MADSISFKTFTEPFTKFADDQDRLQRRAAMWNVREGGRVVRKAARAATPLLRDSYGQSRVEYNRQGRADPTQWRSGGRPVRGLLRASITPSRRLKVTYGVLSRGEDSWALKVGPRGPRAHLYAQKIERQTHYMQTGYAAVASQMQAIAERSHARIWKA